MLVGLQTPEMGLLLSRATFAMATYEPLDSELM